MDSGLVVMDTSIAIITPFIWDNVKGFPMDAHLPNFIHLMVVNRLAKNAAHWVSLFTTDHVNTGTKNSQWIITDFNLFNAGKTVQDNTLWVCETIPGAVEAQDMSHKLRADGYFAGYNRPYFASIRDAAGHAGAQLSHGELYSYSDNPRAQIFRNHMKGLGSLFDMRDLMNRNAWPFEGVEPATPGHSIMARFDLAQQNAVPNGGIDTKVVNACYQKRGIVQAICGPSHVNQPVFQWKNVDGSDKFPGYPHVGMPDSYDFGWVQMSSTGSGPIVDAVC
jgi:hypothetical protein